MTLLQPALLTDGGSHPAALVRRFQQMVALGNEGIDAGADLKVRQTATASTSIIVGPGNGVVRGRASASQGTYFVSNPDDHTKGPDVVPSVASVQHYLVVLRVRDPAYEGTADPNLNMNTIEVVSTALGGTTLAAGTTGIVLARLEVPANTTTITAAMIVDLRKMANPRRQRTLTPVFIPTTPVDPLEAAVDVRENWPDAATLQVAIPIWATLMYVMTTISGVSTRTGNTHGDSRTLVGTAATQAIAWNHDWVGTTQRISVISGGGFHIAAAARGTTQTMRTDAVRRNTTGTLEANGGTTVFFDYEFVEGVV